MANPIIQLWAVMVLALDVLLLLSVKHITMTTVRYGRLPLPHGKFTCAVCAQTNAEAKAFADELYASLQKEHIEVIYDDRNVRPGVMFSDADLLGVPIRLVVSPRNMKDAVVELSSRDKSVQDKVALDAVVPTVKDLIAKMTKEIESK